MDKIKILFSIKVYLLFTLLLLLFQILGLDFLYGFYGFNYLFFSGLFSIFLAFVQVVFLFKYFNEPKKYSNINIGFITFFFVISIISTTYNLYALIYVIYNFYFLFKFFQFKGFLNLEEGEKKDKYIKFTDKNQYKTTLTFYILFILGLIIFYFSYFSVPLINFKHIEDSYFDNTYKYKNISEEENGYQDLITFTKHIKEVGYKDDYISYSSIITGTGSIKEIKFDIDRLNKLDQLREGINDILTKKAIVSEINNEDISLQGFSYISRESIYNTLYYLEKGDEKRGVNYLLENYRFGKMLTSSYTGIIPYIVGLTIQAVTIEEINFIFDNYNLSRDTLEYIKLVINNSPDISDSYKDVINYEYHSMYDFLVTKVEPTPPVLYKSIIFSSKDYLKEGLKNTYYGNFHSDDNLKPNKDGYYTDISDDEMDFHKSEEYFCSNKNKEKFNGKGIFPNYIFKKDIVSNILLQIRCHSMQGYSLDLKNAIIKEEVLMKRIDEILKTTNKSKNTNSVLFNKFKK